MHPSHVSQQARRSGKGEILPRTALDLTHKAAARLRPCSQTDDPHSRHSARFRPCSQTDVPDTGPAAARARRSTTRRSRGSTTAVARARRRTSRRTRGSTPAVAHADTSSQAGAQAPSLNTLGVFSHAPRRRRKRTRRQESNFQDESRGSCV